MAKIKVMQVAAGGYGMSYLRPILAETPNDRYELVGIVDPIANQSPMYERILEKGIPIYDDIETFYSQNTADLVIIAAPIGFHRHYTIYALEHGSNVLCEKPIAATIQDARDMLEAEKRTGKFVAIGFQWSFAKAMIDAKQDFLDGMFGKPKRLKAHVLWRRDWKYYGRNNWAGKLRDSRGGWILDSVAHNATAHYLHNAYFMHGSELALSARPVKIECELYRANDIENFDTCALRAITDQGAEVLYYATHAIDYQIEPFFEYEYEKAKLVYNGHEGIERNIMAAVFNDGTVKVYGNPTPPPAQKLYACLDTIENGAPIPCGIEASTPHLMTINFLADNVPIFTFPEQNIVKDTEQELTWVPGLADIILQSYAENKLPFEVGAPWAKQAQTLDTTRYTEFTGKQYS